MSKKDDDEKFWNFVVFGMYGTDKEVEEMGPLALVILLVVVAIFIIYKALT